MFLPILCFRLPCFLLPCSERSFDKIFPDTYIENEILYFERDRSRRERRKRGIRIVPNLSSRKLVFPLFSRFSNFIFRQSSSALLHRNIFPRRTRLYWKLPEAVATVLPELRKRDRFGEKLEDSWNAEACSNTEKLKNLCDTYRLA